MKYSYLTILFLFITCATVTVRIFCLTKLLAFTTVERKEYVTSNFLKHIIS